jgi:hypothetical protein
MAALATPGSAAAATDLFFREKAFWQFGRSMRLGDEGRLVRQYGRTADTVFPTGTLHKNGGPPYGTDVNLPVTDNERRTRTLRDVSIGMRDGAVVCAREPVNP